MHRIDKARLTDFGVQFLLAQGVSADNATFLAQGAVLTESFGVHTHGVAIFGYWDKMLGDAIHPTAEPKVVKERAATALVDGNLAFGPLALKRAREIAADKARAAGIAMVAVNNTTWIGACGTHILPLAQAGLFAQLWTQTNTCKDCAPWGGIDAKFSTNPISLAFPTGTLPVLADFSTSALSMGKTATMAKAGQKAPENLFLDKDGTLTDDPGVVAEGGSLLFTGGEHYGYRGYGLSLWVEALTAMGGGSANNPDLPTRQCFNLTVIDPEAFAGADTYTTEIKRFLAHMRTSRLRPGFDAILLPGERAQKAAQDAAAHGVTVSEAVFDTLQELAAKHGLQPLA